MGCLYLKTVSANGKVFLMSKITIFVFGKYETFKFQK